MGNHYVIEKIYSKNFLMRRELENSQVDIQILEKTKCCPRKITDLILKSQE
jgi:hypothetical protein